jgi:hypothetical protein
MSGELADWLEALQKTWHEASAQIHYAVKHDHTRQFDQISKQDPELLPRIQQLQAEDQAIEADRESLNQLIDRIATHAPKLEPDEGKAEEHTKNLVDVGLGFVARVRKQEVAIHTWYLEAFNRDRGAVD